MTRPPPTAVWTAAARGAAACSAALARLSPPLLAAATLLATDPPMTPFALAESVAAATLLPALAAHLLARFVRGEADVEGDALALRSRGVRVAVPLGSIARVRPWRIPLPEPGFALELRSGKRLRWAPGARDPSPLAEALAGAGVADAKAALAHPTLVYARARRAARRGAWQHPAVAIGLFSLLPGGVGFYAHQHIAFGGLFGEYYLMGAGAWLRSAAVYWLHAALLLVLYAGTLRLLVDALALAAAWLAPARAALVRRAAEGGAAALYYASVPALLALRFLA